MTLHPQYVIDEKGKKKGVMLSVKEYNELVECAQDVIDASLIEEVAHEERVPWAKVRDGRVGSVRK